MTDVFDKKKRSQVMSCIRSKNTKPEMVVRKYLHKKGLRFRLHIKNLPGKPDLVFPKYKTVLFVHGCFWHRHEELSCKVARLPKSNTEFWMDKFIYNKNRDEKNTVELEKLGWSVLTIWECTLKSKDKLMYLDNLVYKITMSA